MAVPGCLFNSKANVSSSRILPKADLDATLPAGCSCSNAVMASSCRHRSPCGFVDSSIKFWHVYSTFLLIYIVANCWDVKIFFFTDTSSSWTTWSSRARSSGLYYRVRLHWGQDSGIFVLDWLQLRSAPGNFSILKNRNPWGSDLGDFCLGLSIQRPGPAAAEL